jgi:hypothetical protein
MRFDNAILCLDGDESNLFSAGVYKIDYVELLLYMKIIRFSTRIKLDTSKFFGALAVPITEAVALNRPSEGSQQAGIEPKETMTPIPVLAWPLAFLVFVFWVVAYSLSMGGISSVAVYVFIGLGALCVLLLIVEHFTQGFISRIVGLGGSDDAVKVSTVPP